MSRIDGSKRLVQGARLCLGVILIMHQPIGAAVITVDANCDLADAIVSANTDTSVGGCASGSGADEIRLTQDVDLSNQLPQLAGNVTLEGNDFEIRRDDAAPEFSVLHLIDPGPITLQNVTLSNGRATRGGGIYHDGASLTLSHAVVTANVATSNGGGIYVASGSLKSYDSTISYNTAATDGGGLHAYYYVGPLTIVSNTLSGNSAGSDGGGIYSGFRTGVYVTNSTLSGNVAGSEGGGLFVGYWETAVLRNSTIAGNAATTGGGIGGTYPICGPYGSCSEATGTVIAANQGGNCDDVGFEGTLTGNMDDDGSCPAAPISPGVDFDLTLANNGGPTPTHALLSGSAAIDTAGNCGLGEDQRGFARDALCDSGSVEFGAAPFGGSAIGTRVLRVTCKNTTTLQTVVIQRPVGAWDCESAGLVVGPGDGVRQDISGRPSANDIGGTSIGASQLRVQCKNLSTGQKVQFQPSGTLSWSCLDEGLSYGPSDRIGQTVLGVAN